MSYQRRRKGQTALVYKTVTQIDRRGNRIVVEDTDAEATEVEAVFIPDRSARAELPGQQQINVYLMIVDSSIEGVNLWSRVEWRGASWDIVTPPSLHYGTKHVRHWTLSIRQRPS